jgi:hypothetical protein
MNDEDVPVQSSRALGDGRSLPMVPLPNLLDNKEVISNFKFWLPARERAAPNKRISKSLFSRSGSINVHADKTRRKRFAGSGDRSASASPVVERLKQ